MVGRREERKEGIGKELQVSGNEGRNEGSIDVKNGQIKMKNGKPWFSKKIKKGKKNEKKTEKKLI